MTSKITTLLASLKRADILSAIREIDASTVPKNRRSTGFCVSYDGRHYPPKYVINVAAGPQLRPHGFSGGPQSNELLQALGFEIAPCACGGISDAPKRPSEPIGGPPAPGANSAGPRIARLVVIGKPQYSVEEATARVRTVLLEMQRRDEPVDVLVTPGGFIDLTLPHSEPVRGWATPSGALDRIASQCEQKLIPLLVAVSEMTTKPRYITLGVDVDLIEGRAELVATIDSTTSKIVHWTGKSYPKGDYEERHLAHVTDQSTHLQTLGGIRYFILGCHDLNFVQTRTKAKGVRAKRARAMLRAAQAYRPEAVLQHPHQTDTPLTWRNAWLKLQTLLPHVAHASGIAYYPRGGKRRKTIDAVRGGTAKGHVVDYIVSKAGHVTAKVVPRVG